MHIRILTQYFPPETGAPQNRLSNLATHLQALGHQVDILTSIPSYPKGRAYPGYDKRLSYRESILSLRILRCPLYISPSKSLFSRLLTYVSFSISSFFFGLSLPRCDYLIVESPPLFLGLTGLLLSRIQGSRLIFNVSDLWPDSAIQLDLVRNHLILSLAYSLEAYIYKCSYLVTCQTKSISESISSRFPKVRTYWLPNGVDFDVNPVQPSSIPNDLLRDLLSGNTKVFIYAGILGYAQGLEVLVKARSLILSDYPDIASSSRFIVIGDGPCLYDLMHLQASLNTDLIFLPQMPRSHVLWFIQQSFASIVPLRRCPLFLGAIPSKIFDALSLAKPILLGVDGEAHNTFITKGRCGLHFEPEDHISLVNSITDLLSNPLEASHMGQVGLEYAQKYFDRSSISRSFANTLESL